MELKHRHIIGICLLCGLLGATSCNDESIVQQPPAEEDNTVYLAFHTTVVGASTRADGTPDDENINQLRIVIASKASDDTAGASAWEVEENRLITETNIQLSDEYTFRVKADCQKRIYLLANCNGLEDTDGTPLNFTSTGAFLPDANGKALVDSYVFGLGDKDGGYQYATALKAGNGIPMTSVYEITIPPKDEAHEEDFANGFYQGMPEVLYVVRAATKFSFAFGKTAKRAINVTGFSLKKAVKDRMYLMPHANKDASGKYWVADTGDKDNPSKATLTGEGTAQDWITWMVAESEKTESEAIQYQWLTDYEVPQPEEGEEDGDVAYSFSKAIEVSSLKAGEEAKFTTPVYLPESDGTLAQGKDANLKLQEYEVTIHTEEGFDEEATAPDSPKVARSYTATLPNLASLFRNTHVKVKVNFKNLSEAELELEVDVEPYWEVVLDPVFGLDEKGDPKKR